MKNYALEIIEIIRRFAEVDSPEPLYKRCKDFIAAVDNCDNPYKRAYLAYYEDGSINISLDEACDFPINDIEIRVVPNGEIRIERTREMLDGLCVKKNVEIA